jgi:hypothetical protein
MCQIVLRAVVALLEPFSGLRGLPGFWWRRRMRRVSKSAVQEAREALAAGRAPRPECGSRFSRRDDTQAQLFALLVLRQFLRTDDRGVVALAGEWAELRRALHLSKVPHYSKLAHASRRILADAEAGGPSAALRPWWSSAPAGAA